MFTGELQASTTGDSSPLSLCDEAILSNCPDYFRKSEENCVVARDVFDIFLTKLDVHVFLPI